MLPLMEMLLKSGNGNALQQMQDQFGLNAADAENAIEAVLPAFSRSLKHNASDPQGFGAFMEALSRGSHQKYVEDPLAAMSGGGLNEGNAILGHLFGSKDVSREIAKAASGKSGVSESIIKQMLPAIASMVMGGISGQSTGNAQMFGGNAGGGIIGTILEQMMKGGLGGGGKMPDPSGRGNSRAPSGRGNNPLGDILDQMMGGGGTGQRQGQQRQRSPQMPGGIDNPLGQIFEEMLSGKRSQYDGGDSEPRTQRRNDPRYDEDDIGKFEDLGPASERFEERYRRDEPEEPARRTERKPTGSGLEDLFGDMFETGRKRDEPYERGINDIFDKIMNRR